MEKFSEAETEDLVTEAREAHSAPSVDAFVEEALKYAMRYAKVKAKE
jgi:hypothetical protein